MVVIVAVIVNSYLGFYGIIKIKIQILLKGLDKNYMISQALTSVTAMLKLIILVVIVMASLLICDKIIAVIMYFYLGFYGII